MSFETDDLEYYNSALAAGGQLYLSIFQIVSTVSKGIEDTTISINEKLNPPAMLGRME